VRSGRLRAGIGVVAPHWAIKDPQSGELKGIAVELARALAQRLGIEAILVLYPSPPAVLQGVKDNAWDVGFLAIDKARMAVVDFTPPYLSIDATFLARPGLPVQTVADVDKPSIRIAVTAKSVEEITLRAGLKQAQLIAVETIPAGFDLVQNGQADLLAAPRPALIPLSRRLAESRVLADRFAVAYGAIAVPKDQPGRLAYVSRFVGDAKASGQVRAAIDKLGVQGVDVAPANAKP
jgi:polar amino acid transport system substrate-binding protein